MGVINATKRSQSLNWLGLGTKGENGPVKSYSLFDDIKNVKSIDEIKKMGKKMNLYINNVYACQNIKSLANHWEINLQETKEFLKQNGIVTTFEEMILADIESTATSTMYKEPKTSYNITSKRVDRKIMKLSGEGIRYNMVNTIEDVKSLSEIQLMPHDKAQEYLIKVRRQYPMKSLIAHWIEVNPDHNTRLYGSKIYGIMYNYKIPLDQNRNEIKNCLDKNDEAPIIDTDFQIFDSKHQEPVQQPVQQPIQQPVQLEIPTPKFEYSKAVPSNNTNVVQAINEQTKKESSFIISLYGEMTGEQIAEKLNSIGILLNNGGKYNVTIKLEEIGD